MHAKPAHLSALLFASLLLPGADAQGSRRSAVPLRDSQIVHARLRPAVESASHSVVTVVSDGNDVALGTVVDAGGLIVTKASELGEVISCRMPGGRKLEAQRVAVDEPFDIALLKVDAERLVAVEWADANAEQGQFVVSINAEGKPLAVGIVGVNPRPIPVRRGFLGVELRELSPGAGGVQVRQVVPNTAAAQIGLRPGDLIVQVQGAPVRRTAEVIERIGAHRVGAEVELLVRREHQAMAVVARLGARDDDEPLDGPSSAVRSGFPNAFHHDSFVFPHECGGPLVNLEGQVVGLNIAREGRIGCLAVPAKDVKQVIDSMQTQLAHATKRL